MDNNFIKPFLILLGVGAAVSLAKSLKTKKRWQEIVSEMIISSLLATGAGVTLLVYPEAPLIAVVGIASLLSILGVTYVSDKLEQFLDSHFGDKDKPNG